MPAPYPKGRSRGWIENEKKSRKLTVPPCLGEALRRGTLKKISIREPVVKNHAGGTTEK
jgi:hypothetical protein